MKVRIGDKFYDADRTEVRDVPNETRLVVIEKNGERHGSGVEGITYDLDVKVKPGQ